ncbi:hypothetical protein AN219_37945 [Streptomyces nanshensis]|nr:hypothetical protein AN219_37945 [Streptomyces nanshensis]
MTERHTRVVDVFVLLRRRDGRVLLLRRAGDSYASGLLCPPSGHLEAGETVTEGTLREAAEEVGVHISPDDARFCHLIDHRSPEGQQRLGVAFAVGRWSGEIHNREPHKHSELVWVDPADPPGDCVPYTAALLAAVTDDRVFSAHGYAGAQSSTDLQHVEGRSDRW